MTIRTLSLGALAGIIGFLLGHQVMIELFYHLELVSFRGYRTAAVGPMNVPAVVNGAFWCMLWGMLMALIWHRLPGKTPGLKGLLFGLIFVQAIGNWIFVPFFKNVSYFHGWNLSWMLITACFQASFGLVMGLAYGFLRNGKWRAG
jgi:hypothetical protein